MSVRTRPMFAIPFAINLGSVAVILRQCGFASCNQRAHGPPMFAIPTPDVCRSLQVGLVLRSVLANQIGLAILCAFIGAVLGLVIGYAVLGRDAQLSLCLLDLPGAGGVEWVV